MFELRKIKKSKPKTKPFTVRYFWDGEFYTVNVEALDEHDAKLKACVRARQESDHHPYVLHIIRDEV